MLSVFDAEKARILQFIGKKFSNKQYELEARFSAKTGVFEGIQKYEFNNVMRRYIFSRENGGYGLEKKVTTQLNVTGGRTPNIRESVRGLKEIKLYWTMNDITMVKKEFPSCIIQMEKKRVDSLNLYNYEAVKISLSDEKITSNDDLKLLNDRVFIKNYRFQNRTSVFTEDGFFRIDFTQVKNGIGKTFRESKTIQAFPSYEIEIEFINPKDDKNPTKEEIFNIFMENISKLLVNFRGTPLIITDSMQKNVLDNYLLLISKDEKLKKSNRKNRNRNHKNYNHRDFITAKPVTLHIENVKKNSGINILSNYGVTYKADGANMLLYVAPLEKLKNNILKNLLGNKKFLENQSDLLMGNVFLIDVNFNILATGLTITEWEGSLIEGEYIKNFNVFYAYDMLYAKNLDIRNKLFESFSNSSKQTSRLGYLRDFLKFLENQNSQIIEITEKKYLFGNDEEIFLQAKKLWNERTSVPYFVDGLIFIPAIEPYPKEGGSWKRLLKWKPIELNSIDFLIKTKKSTNKRDILYPYTNPQNNEIVQYKKVKLYTTAISDKFNRRTGTMNRANYSKIFKEVNIPVNFKNQMMAFDPLSNQRSEIQDDTIIEFIYDSNDKDFPWKPIRIRYDKTVMYKINKTYFGNSYKVALDIWKSIENPVTVEMITSGNIHNLKVKQNSNTPYATTSISSDVKGKRLPYQTFHSAYVKKTLLSDVIDNLKKDNISLIDFGVCRGGDLNRWKELGIKKVIGIDKDTECIQEAIKRYENSLDNDYNVVFICGDLSKLIFPNQLSACPVTDTPIGIVDWKKIMISNLPQKYMFDIVSSQFVIHYFFKNELSLRSYLQNVTDNLKIGGYFCGTTFDGSKVYKVLKKLSEKEGKTTDNELIWRITKLYENKKFYKNKPNFGMEINVFINSIGYDHKEYLVNFEYLEKISKEYGLQLKKLISFSDLWKQGSKNKSISANVSLNIKSMTESEKEFSFLFSAFVFEKIKKSPVSTYKKILKLQNKNKKS